MRILVVAATAMEVAPIVAKLGSANPAIQERACHAARGPSVTRYEHAGHGVDVLITGIGMVATAALCSRALAETSYDLALNLGVCGSFDRTLEPGRVVHVVSDRLAELGAENGDASLSVDELELPRERVDPAEAGHDPWNGRRLTSAELVNVAPPSNAALTRLPAVRGITVNTVHGNDRSIAAVVRRFQPQVESMEGAAFMYACLIHELAFAQVRAVSNIVERRNRQAWRMADAIRALSAVAVTIVDTL
jgi:futalosine hydrolase